jgi:hypothetical protein
MRLRAIILAFTFASCHSTTHPDVTGTYQFVSPDFNNAAGKLLDQRLIVTLDRVTIASGAYETTGEYQVKDGFLYVVSGQSRFGYQIIGRDTLRYEGPLSLSPIDYVRVKQ